MGLEGKKVLISAPTGMGKTTFIIKTLLNYLRKRRKKLLVLCNRRLLRIQYWNSIVDQFISCVEIERCVMVTTYQNLTEMIKRKKSLRKFFEDYETIVCDECHYFYADSDFNGLGTYALLQEIAYAGAERTMIFMSATMDEVSPLIERTIKNCLWRLSRTERNTRICSENERIIKYDYSQFADYDRFRCIYVPDIETLCEILISSPKKSVVFINNKEKGVALKERMLKTRKIATSQIEIINADNIDGDGDVVQNLAIGNRLLPKILITTAVLDNGVSIQDAEVGNVMIETESKIEFLQMLGRIRAENVEECNLYFVQRDKSEFMKRMNRYREEQERFKMLTTPELRKNRDFYLQEILEDGELSDFYKRALVWMKFESQYYVFPENESIYLNKETDLYVNEFARLKIGDMYVTESRFYALALSDPLKVAYEQMAWIGKMPEELQILESEYRKTREQELVDILLAVKGYTKEKLQEVKVKLVKEFRRDLFPDVLANNGTISNDKLGIICDSYGLELIEKSEPEKRIKLYSIRNKEIEKKEDML